MTIRLGHLIGEGNTAEIYEIGGNKVLKLYRVGFPSQKAEAEYGNSKLFYDQGIPSPKSYGMVVHEGRQGIVYDKIDGPSLLEVLFQTHEIEKYTKVLVRLHKHILACPAPSAVSCKTVLRRSIEGAAGLSQQRKSRLLEILQNLPDGERLCHGDFHFGNILATQEGYMVIDFMCVCKGHPAFDIARSFFLMEFPALQAGLPSGIRDFTKQVGEIYLREMGVARGELSGWLNVVAAARLTELGGGQTLEKNAVMRYLAAQGL